jgi:hypothetical protein
MISVNVSAASPEWRAASLVRELFWAEVETAASKSRATRLKAKKVRNENI